MKSAKLNKKNKNSENKKAKIYLRNILARIPGSVYWKDRNGVYLGCNDFQAKMAGYNSAEDVIGKTDFDFSWKNIAADLVKTDRKIMETGEAQYLEEMPTLADGRQITMLTCKAPLQDEQGNVIGIIGTSVDITELKQAQEALKQAYRSKSEFLATASHEIRNPIGNVIYSIDDTNELITKLKNTIYDTIDILNEAGKYETIKQIQSLFKQIYEQNKQTKAESYRALNSLINLGNLHRLQLEGLAAKYEVSNIIDLINLAIENSIYPNKSKVDIHKNINPTISEEIVIDYNNIYEALRAVIGNAIRFSEAEGIVKINVTSSAQANKKSLIITVQDFGIGIAETQLEHIFETLHQKNNEETPSNYWKPSLQLPQAKMRIEASGGTLEIKSAPKKGTTITMTVPYYESNADVANCLQLEIEDKFAKTACSILLVEDDIFAQKIVKNYLEEYKHQVEVAATSAEAVEMARSKNYDIILMDITLPDKNGVETKKLIQTIAGNKSLFIAVTSHAAENDADYFISQGFVTVLAKPVNKLTLKKCIEDVIVAKVSEDNEDD